MWSFFITIKENLNSVSNTVNLCCKGFVDFIICGIYQLECINFHAFAAVYDVYHA